MGTQLRIISIAFIVFGIVAWLIQSYSPAYVGLILMGAIGVGASIRAVK